MAFVPTHFKETDGHPMSSRSGLGQSLQRCETSCSSGSTFCDARNHSELIQNQSESHSKSNPTNKSYSGSMSRTIYSKYVIYSISIYVYIYISYKIILCYIYIYILYSLGGNLQRAFHEHRHDIQRVLCLVSKAQTCAFSPTPTIGLCRHIKVRIMGYSDDADTPTQRTIEAAYLAWNVANENEVFGPPTNRGVPWTECGCKWTKYLRSKTRSRRTSFEANFVNVDIYRYQSTYCTLSFKTINQINL